MDSLDLAALGTWERTVEVAWQGRQARVRLRVVGDRGPALEAGFAAMERELAAWGPGSARYQALARLLATLPPEELAEEALEAELPRLQRAAERALPDPPLSRDLAAGESAGDFARRRACWQEEGRKRAARREEMLARLVEERRQALLALGATDLAARVLPGRIQQAGWEACEQAALCAMLAEAVRDPEDGERRLFAGPEQVQALPGAVREALAAAYRDLDLGLAGDLPKG